MFEKCFSPQERNIMRWWGTRARSASVSWGLVGLGSSDKSIGMEITQNIFCQTTNPVECGISKQQLNQRFIIRYDRLGIAHFIRLFFSRSNSSVRNSMSTFSQHGWFQTANSSSSFELLFPQSCCCRFFWSVVCGLLVQQKRHSWIIWKILQT